jgi:hypothetical protein
VLPPLDFANESRHAVHRDAFFDVIVKAVTLGRGSDVLVLFSECAERLWLSVLRALCSVYGVGNVCGCISYLN